MTDMLYISIMCQTRTQHNSTYANRNHVCLRIHCQEGWRGQHRMVRLAAALASTDTSAAANAAERYLLGSVRQRKFTPCMKSPGFGMAAPSCSAGLLCWARCRKVPWYVPAPMDR